MNFLYTQIVLKFELILTYFAQQMGYTVAVFKDPRIDELIAEHGKAATICVMLCNCAHQDLSASYRAIAG